MINNFKSERKVPPKTSCAHYWTLLYLLQVKFMGDISLMANFGVRAEQPSACSTAEHAFKKRYVFSVFLLSAPSRRNVNRLKLNFIYTNGRLLIAKMSLTSKLQISLKIIFLFAVTRMLNNRTGGNECIIHTPLDRWPKKIGCRYFCSRC